MPVDACNGAMVAPSRLVVYLDPDRMLVLGGEVEMISNPMSRGRLKNGNPAGDLSNLRHCGAKTRAGGACQQPAMPNGKCRLHGGKSPGAPRGERNGNYRHGLRTIEAMTERREAARVRRMLRQLGEALSQSP